MSVHRAHLSVYGVPMSVPRANLGVYRVRASVFGLIPVYMGFL